MYIYELNDWPAFYWDKSKITNTLSEVSFLLGSLFGKIKALGFDYKQSFILENITNEISKSAEIEGELLNLEQVRSSVARKLNINNDKMIESSHHIDGIVEMMIDATHNYNEKLSLDRLFSWHATLFPTGYSGMFKINVASFRNDKNGPMQVISSDMGKRIVYFEAPPANKLPEYLNHFLNWINNNNDINPIIKSSIAHLWFITLHPFEDGNGRIARAITDMMLSRAENSPYRFYSMSAQIQKEKKEYYSILEKTQKGSLDITGWIEWFLKCLSKSILSSDAVIEKTITKSLCWQEYNKIPLDTKQKKIINMLLNGFEGKLTSSKWAKICNCSQDTAIRSINYLIENRILRQEGTGRGTHYVLNNSEISTPGSLI